MFFVGINILEVIKLNENNENREVNWKNELFFGLKVGSTLGSFASIAAFLALNIIFLLPPKGVFELLSTIIVWISVGMHSSLFYKPFRWAIHRNIAFLVGLLAIIAVANHIYNMLILYNIDLPYSSLQASKIVALVIIGTSFGLIIKVVAKMKKEKVKEIAQ